MGLVDSKIRASDKDLPVKRNWIFETLWFEHWNPYRNPIMSDIQYLWHSNMVDVPRLVYCQVLIKIVQIDTKMSQTKIA